ncbi:MAG TPA: pyridoxamine 5'-phosphate oxidase family protein [Beijerinckiaceae bacterium]|jgi:PPOX class probable FMN-dependent enzyme|nr:pyridoxamine 5'-phosphate oxidase family protein [Beijerinckiaceae bacterium]
MTVLRSVEELEELYGRPKGGAVFKEIPFLNAHYRAFIEASPFVVLASAGPGGLDCSPKGDAPGFVRVLDKSTLAIPDRPGNNRIDTLRNLVIDPRLALLFLVPSRSETLRVNGRAVVSTDAELLASFTVEGKAPRSVIRVTVESAYVHCAKAFMRSKLWERAAKGERPDLPSMGEMMALLSQNSVDAAVYDRDAPERLKATLY